MTLCPASIRLPDPLRTPSPILIGNHSPILTYLGLSECTCNSFLIASSRTWAINVPAYTTAYKPVSLTTPFASDIETYSPTYLLTAARFAADCKISFVIRGKSLVFILATESINTAAIDNVLIISKVAFEPLRTLALLTPIIDIVLAIKANLVIPTIGVRAIMPNAVINLSIDTRSTEDIASVAATREVAVMRIVDIPDKMELLIISI